MLLERTPYKASGMVTTHTPSGHLGPMLQGYDNATDVIVEDGYIRVVQDIRGKYGSEGDYVMTRPPMGPLNPTKTDDTTDAWDTIDWLTASRDNSTKWWSSYDEYDLFLQAGSAGAYAEANGFRQLPWWNRFSAHPAYDSFWQHQALDKLLVAHPSNVPTMWLQGLWDQEDIYGALAVYRAIKPKDSSGSMVKLVMGPWHHGQEIEDASWNMGPLKWPGNTTGLYFREP
ncbi:MAG: hypothetical protein WDW38_006430 [Sanguina aurantia]